MSVLGGGVLFCFPFLLSAAFYIVNLAGLFIAHRVNWCCFGHPLYTLKFVLELKKTMYVRVFVCLSGF